jgi:hypothetical protein
MNLKVSGLGAEPKKLAALGVLALIGTYFYLSNRPSSDSSGSSVSSHPMSTPADVPVSPVRNAKTGRAKVRSSAQYEFRPTLKFKEGQIDRANIDPTLRLDLLERVQNVKIGDVNRSLFESLTAAPVQIAKNIPEPAKIKIAFPYQGPQQAAKVVAAAAPPEPAAPPIPLKFYGFINPVRTVGPKRAFFLDGDDIVVANEGQMIKNRYKIVRIGVNSADVEDTQFKKNSRQTLPLVPEEQQS